MNLLNWKKNIPLKGADYDSPFLSLQNEFAKSINAFNKMMQTAPFSTKAFEELTINPSIDIVEDKESYKVEVEMPGVGEENVHVSIHDGALVITAEKSISKKNKDKHYLSREINYGSYMRTISLPESVDIDKAKASFKKGMLWVTIPKKLNAIKHSKEIKIEKAQ